MRGALSSADVSFLVRLRDDCAAHDGWAVCTSNPPSAAIRQLVAGGYCRLAEARSGPLGLHTGEIMVGITDAGRAALAGLGGRP